MKRRPHGRLYSIHIRGEADLIAGVDEARRQNGDGLGEWISRGEMAKQLIWWALRHLDYAPPPDPDADTQRLPAKAKRPRG